MWQSVFSPTIAFCWTQLDGAVRAGLSYNVMTLVLPDFYDHLSFIRKRSLLILLICYILKGVETAFIYDWIVVPESFSIWQRCSVVVFNKNGIGFNID